MVVRREDGAVGQGDGSDDAADGRRSGACFARVRIGDGRRPRVDDLDVGWVKPDRRLASDGHGLGRLGCAGGILADRRFPSRQRCRIEQVEPLGRVEGSRKVESARRLLGSWGMSKGGLVVVRQGRSTVAHEGAERVSRTVGQAASDCQVGAIGDNAGMGGQLGNRGVAAERFGNGSGGVGVVADDLEALADAIFGVRRLEACRRAGVPRCGRPRCRIVSARRRCTARTSGPRGCPTSRMRCSGRRCSMRACSQASRRWLRISAATARGCPRHSRRRRLCSENRGSSAWCGP